MHLNWRTPTHSSRLFASALFAAVWLALCAPISALGQTIQIDPLPSRAQATPRGDKQVAELSDQLGKLHNLALFRSDEYLIRGQTVFEGSTLATKKLLFEKGSNLILAPKEGDTVTILADIIVIQGEALVTWVKPPAPATIPPTLGEAPGGSLGRDFGEPGAPGFNGESGNTGLPGGAAPNLVIVYTEFNKGDLSVDLRGGPGGRGGLGQKGGRGGRGAEGMPARSGMIGCTAGAGRGGKGGQGGNGGLGGRGGQGGPGGTLLLISLRLDDAKNDLFVFNGGGKGGLGGEGGLRGEGGAGGRPGAPAPPYCRAEPDRTGEIGADGEPGKTGPEGYVGQTGPFVRVKLNQEEAASVFKTP